MAQNKTLIGKNNILFLNNDACEELNVHCNNLIKVSDLTLSRYTFNKFIMFIYPNKSLIYKDYLPDKYIFKYRNALDIYKKKLKDNIYDLYEIFKYETDIYYKTDTHINFKGNYIVYKYFIEIINSRLGLNIIPKIINLNIKNCELKSLQYGIGDLTWSSNLGDQILDDITDNFYFNDEYAWFYNIYIIKNDNNIRFLDYKWVDNSNQEEGNLVGWKIISNYIIYVKKNDKIPLKIIIFYDSFLLNILPLYFDIFNEIYLIKSVYSNNLINLINPNYVFEFRVERFLV